MSSKKVVKTKRIIDAEISESNNNKIESSIVNDIIEGNVILERPLKDIKDDKFNITPYVEQLKKACKADAIFIAVDGKYGSGKSSIVQLFKNDVEDESNVFVNVNFMNINSIPEKKDNTKSNDNFNETNDDEKSKVGSVNKSLDDERDKKLLINDYHRYFVNQVINDICKDPYEFERLFYNQKFSYTTINLKKQTDKDKKYKKIIDRIILWLIGGISIYTLYGSFLDNESHILHNIYESMSPFFTISLLLTFILIILYGYGFYKPDKNEQSPMLDTDKCRNNFLKVINDYLINGTTLYLIIDDLDRIKDSNIQLQIISLLFNEYYPVNELINNIKIKFIFMIDIEKINQDNELKPTKMFDYILSVSSNQKNIMKHYIQKFIEENKELNEIFNIENCEYFIGLIASQFKTMREIKHLLNKIITKYLYIKSKNIKCDKSQLIIISILTSLSDETNISNCIEDVLNKTKNYDDNNEIFEIIQENVNSKVIDKNYYIYIYNFIDQSNLLTPSEESIFDYIVNNDFQSLNQEKIDTINDLIDNKYTRLDKIYEECYKYVGNNKKIILLGNKKFYNYMESRNLIDKHVLYNSYLNNSIYNFYLNISKNLSDEDRQNIIASLIEKFNSLEENTNNYNDLYLSFKKFIKNLKEFILDFDIEDIFSQIKIDDDLFKILSSINKDSNLIIYNLIAKEYVKIASINDRITKEFIETIKSQNIDLAFEVEKKILESEISNEIKLYIIVNEEKKFENIASIYNKFLSSNLFITTVDLEKLMSKYGYNELLDNYIIAKLKENTTRYIIINCIKKNEFNISKNILDTLNGLNTKYGYSKHYEDILKKENYYELLIYSQAINSNKFKIDITLNNNVAYKKAIYDVYKNMGSTFKNYNYTEGFLNKILSVGNFSNIDYNENNFWKIDILIPCLDSYQKCLNIFESLKNANKLIKYANYCKKNKNYKYLRILDYLGMYTSEMSAPIKRSITIAKNSINEEEKVS